MRLNRLGATLLCTLVFWFAGCSTVSPDREANRSESEDSTEVEGRELRVATFNASLSRGSKGQLVSALAGGDDQQARKVARVLQTVRPDIVLVNEFDWDEEGDAAELFLDNYLSVGQGELEPLNYEHHYVPDTNTGLHSGHDLDNNGDVVSTSGSRAYGNDAYGFGMYHGQYGMVVYSKYPIRKSEIRSFQEFLWQEMSHNLMPEQFYSSEEQESMRLSSKNHVDIPVNVGGRTIHLLASHPTPPSFDGSADRNGRRNHDEIRFWADYISNKSYIRDDSGEPGGLPADESFFVVGDLNSDPYDGGSRHDAIEKLIDHERVAAVEPASEGAIEASDEDGGANENHEGPDRLDTADFDDGRVGNLRVDYALPSENLNISNSGVFWPPSEDSKSELVTVSDHRLVWVDIEVELPEAK
jgi:endonuclease/exonuclease/phosphatase family metal-dependent hydrolase